MIQKMVVCAECETPYVKGAKHSCARKPKRLPLLVERQKTHGSFETNAKYSQELKVIFRGKFDNLNSAHKEALDMIALKLSRILSGQAQFKDHWDDIAGYAKLASEACD